MNLTKKMQLESLTSSIRKYTLQEFINSYEILQN